MSTIQTNAMHLTDEQIDDYLMGDLAADGAAHLAGCAVCTERVALVAEPIASFKAVSLAWSERQSATMSNVPSAKASRWGQRLAWASAMAAALVLAVSVPVLRHESKTSEQASAKAPAVLMAVSGPLNALTPAQSADHDDQMLREINSLASPNELPSLLQPTSSSHTRTHGAAERD